MVRKLIAWALDSPLVVILLAIFLGIFGLMSFHNVSVEAYPDPAPAIVEVIAMFPGASAEEVERQVTIPLEVTFAGMPGLRAKPPGEEARDGAAREFLHDPAKQLAEIP